MFYFLQANNLLKQFAYVWIDHIPRVENRKANDLAQIASGYRIPRERLEYLVKVKKKHGL